MAAKELVKRGMRWRVGDGTKIDIWLDKWVPSITTQKVTSPVAHWSGSTSVAELIDLDSRSWRTNLLQRFFNPMDRVNIQKIPILRQPTEDKLIWGVEKSGTYMVKSTYRLWEGRNDDVLREIYTPVNWKRLWNLKIPPEVWIFAWRWARNIIPTGARVYDRMQKGSENCPFCNLRETQGHIFRKCDWVRRVWRSSPMERGENLTSEEWYCELQEMESDEQLGEFLVALWYIWDQRNCYYWNKKKVEEWEILPRVSNWLKDYLEKQLSPRQSERNDAQGWQPPTIAPVKINVDAACIADRGTRWGVVIRDGGGRFLFAGVRRSRIQWNPEEAEAMAIGFVLDLARRFELMEMEMESDCQGIIQ
ncbi:unnamed protein product [Linum trigynum]|uniref:Reverse transcriptase zinc-binding domain-containing protein n=1 Tax=Linum trigynum TaxID=586398 RepID=A0AAV2EEK2_9ROSI